VGQLVPEHLGLPSRSQPRELAPQGLDLRRTVQPQQAAQVRGRVLLEPLRSLDAQERHEQQGQHRGPQAVEGRAEVPIDLLGYRDDAAVDQRRNRQQHPSAGDAAAGHEARVRVLEQAEPGQQSVEQPGLRVRVETRSRR
jgi:hypothetical protein